MIVREWRARASGQNVSRYEQHFREHVLPKLAGIQGFKGAQLLRRDDGRQIELVVLTMWASMDTVKQFAGAQPDRAVVEPDAQAVLDQFDPFVRHYEVIASAGT